MKQNILEKNVRNWCNKNKMVIEQDYSKNDKTHMCVYGTEMNKSKQR
jgi:hypothetical protein